MMCKAPDKHSEIVRVIAFGISVRVCGCPLSPVATSVAPVTASPNEDRFPR